MGDPNLHGSSRFPKHLDFVTAKVATVKKVASSGGRLAANKTAEIVRRADFIKNY